MPNQIPDPRVVVLPIYQLEQIAKLIHETNQKRSSFQELDKPHSRDKVSRPKQLLPTSRYHQFLPTPKRPILAPRAWRKNEDHQVRRLASRSFNPSPNQSADNAKRNSKGITLLGRGAPATIQSTIAPTRPGTY